MVDTPLVYPAGSCGMLGIVTRFEIEAAPVREVVHASIVVEADLGANAPSRWSTMMADSLTRLQKPSMVAPDLDACVFPLLRRLSVS
jgi:hypothetical protein